MPTIPSVRNLDATSVQVLNAIRNSASTNYREYVPEARDSVESIREIGAVIMDYPALQNEFINSLINRIGRVIITSKMYSNPWKAFKRGLLEFGEVVEEVFVAIAVPASYDPQTAENDVFKRKMPDVKTAFHVLNYQKFYKTTIQSANLRQAFLSWSGITDLIAKIVDSMYSAAYYDEFQVMKYMVAKHILDGHFKPEAIPEVSTPNMHDIAADIKGVSNAFEFMSTKYNLAGVPTFSKKDSQYLIVNAGFDAVMDVDVLAAAFNMDKAEFIGHKVLVDSFGALDTERLALLFPKDGWGTQNPPISAAQLAALDTVPAILVDETWFMIFDNLYEFTEQYNGEGLYWNYWYHVWKTFSVSPFANAVVFVYDINGVGITSVTVSPDEAVATAGQRVQLEAVVATTGYASQAVNWSLSAVDSESAPITNIDASVSTNGLVNIGSEVEAGTVITVTATSVVDSTKSDSATITVGTITTDDDSTVEQSNG